MSDKKSTTNITRRTFVKGSALAVGGAAAAGMLPSVSMAQSVDRTGCKVSSWEEPFKAIQASEIKKTVDTEVLVIGAGLAGMCAALSAKENGVKSVTVIEKNRTYAARGAHITAFGAKVQAEYGFAPNYRQIIRELVRWAQGRVNEDLIWLFAQKSGACFDWLSDHMKTRGIRAGLWNQYYTGPDYTEYPVTGMFEETKTGVRGNVPVVRSLTEIAAANKIDIVYSMKAAQFIRQGGGRVTGVIAGRAGNYTQYNASKGVIIATGDYASNSEMVNRYAPIAAMADAQIYFPNKCNTGDAHIMAMQIGGAMQKVEPHAVVIHLEAGATSYGFLHVNALGKRFKNEDVNTQSKSCSKLFEKDGIAWTIYDADGLNQVKEQMDNGVSGGLFYGQMLRMYPEKYDLKEEQDLLETQIKQGKVMTADTLDALAGKMNVPVGEFKKTVENYNKLCRQKNDSQYGKRPELLQPVVKPPFYAGKLLATVLTTVGGLRTNSGLQVLDANDKPVEGLYVVGSAAGDFFAADYPTLCPGIGHGRCVTFGRLAGFIVAGKSVDAVPSIQV